MDTTALDFYLKNHPWKEMPRKNPTDATYILTGPVRLRWCSLDKPRSTRRKGEPPKLDASGQPIPDRKVYDVTALIPEQANVDALRAVKVRLMSERFGADFATTLVKPMTLPNGETIVVSAETGGVKKQADMFAKKEAGFTNGGFYFSASTGEDYPPAIIGAKKDAFGNFVALDRGGPEVYQGMWVLLYLKVYTRPKQGVQNPGISFQLESIQKIADDSKFESKGKTGHFGEIESHVAPGSGQPGSAQPGSALNGSAPAKAPVVPAGF